MGVLQSRKVRVIDKFKLRGPVLYICSIVAVDISWQKGTGSLCRRANNGEMEAAKV